MAETFAARVRYEDGEDYILTFAIEEGALVQVAPPRAERLGPTTGTVAANGESQPPFGELPLGESLELRSNPQGLVYRTGAREMWGDVPVVISTRPPSVLYDVGYGLALVPAVAIDVALTPLYAVVLVFALFAMA
ncbi:MAG: hypothetical protein ACYTFT_05640 [Planctomycetota bacterium]|jgi:hypothetical protein